MSDERIKKTSGSNRTSRAMQDRPVTDKREVSDDERLEMQEFGVKKGARETKEYHQSWVKLVSFVIEQEHQRSSFGQFLPTQT